MKFPRSLWAFILNQLQCCNEIYFQIIASILWVCPITCIVLPRDPVTLFFRPIIEVHYITIAIRLFIGSHYFWKRPSRLYYVIKVIEVAAATWLLNKNHSVILSYLLWDKLVHSVKRTFVWFGQCHNWGVSYQRSWNNVSSNIYLHCKLIQPY